MRLAIVFGTYNRKELLLRAITSVRKAVGCLSYDIIVVDGGSTDGSREFLALQPDVVLIGQRGPLTGAVKAFNLGFTYAVDNSYEYVCHLNDDAEIITENGLEKAVRMLQADSKIGEVAFSFDLYGAWHHDHVNGKPYANFGVIRRETGIAVAKAQGDVSGRNWWNPIYRTYGADSEFGVWVWKLGWKVETTQEIKVHDVQAMDALRASNEASNPERLDSKLFWGRWRDEDFSIIPSTRLPAARQARATNQAKQIMVTGGTGFLGQHLIKQLKNEPTNVVTAPTRTRLNLLNEQETISFIHATQPSTIYHLAASVGGIGANLKNPVKFFEDNMLMGMNVLKAAQNWVDKIVLVGTVCSYPVITPVPFKEDYLWTGFPEKTNSAYGVAKRSLITLAEAYRIQFNKNVVTAILANLYGPNDHFDLENSHVIPAMIRKFLEAKTSNQSYVTLWGDGSPSREFLFVKDAARALELIAAKYDDAKPINVGTGIETSIKQLAELIKELVDFNGALTWDRTKPNGQLRRSLDITNITKLGFVAKTSLRDGLEETIKWYKASYGKDGTDSA